MKVSILIPVYNEGKTLSKLLCRVQRAALPLGCEREIIVIDDGSEDGTMSVLNAFSSLIAIRIERNRGKGSAIRSGLAVATGDVILIQDGDLEYDPSDYAALLTPIVQDKADIVYGSRFLGSAVGMRLGNRIANFTLTAAANLLYGAKLTDEATGYKAVRTAVLRNSGLQCCGFDFCSELTAKVSRMGYRIHEVPISYRARAVTEGKKIRATDWFRAIWPLLKFRFVNAGDIGQISEVNRAESRIAMNVESRSSRC